MGDYTSLIHKPLSIVFSGNCNKKCLNWPGFSRPEFKMFSQTLHKVYCHPTRIMRSTPNSSSISRDICVQQSFLPGHQVNHLTNAVRRLTSCLLMCLLLLWGPCLYKGRPVRLSVGFQSLLGILGIESRSLLGAERL